MPIVMCNAGSTLFVLVTEPVYESRDHYWLANLNTLTANFCSVKDACSDALAALPLRPGGGEVRRILYYFL